MSGDRLSVLSHLCINRDVELCCSSITEEFWGLIILICVCVWAIMIKMLIITVFTVFVVT